MQNTCLDLHFGHDEKIKQTFQGGSKVGKI